MLAFLSVVIDYDVEEDDDKEKDDKDDDGFNDQRWGAFPLVTERYRSRARRLTGDELDGATARNTFVQRTKKLYNLCRKSGEPWLIVLSVIMFVCLVKAGQGIEVISAFPWSSAVDFENADFVFKTWQF